MSISNKTRKELWAKSGNRCAICKKKLVNKISKDEDSFIIGDERWFSGTDIVRAINDEPDYTKAGNYYQNH